MSVSAHREDDPTSRSGTESSAIWEFEGVWQLLTVTPSLAE